MLSNEATRLTMAPSWPNPHLQSAANLISLEMGCHQSFHVPCMREEDLIAANLAYRHCKKKLPLAGYQLVCSSIFLTNKKIMSTPHSETPWIPGVFDWEGSF